MVSFPSIPFHQQRNDFIANLVRGAEILDPFFAPERHQIIVEISTECPIGKPNELKMKPLHAFSEHLEFAEKTELLQLHVAQQSVGLG